MQVSMWAMLGCIFGAGFVGGIINAIMTQNGLVLWKKEEVGTPGAGKATVWRLGWTTNAVIGGVAAVVSWGLYGPVSSALIMGTPAAFFHAGVRPETLGLTLASFVGAILVGIAGTRWLSNEVDKKLLRAAAAQAAIGASSPKAATQIAVASPTEAFHIAKGLLGGGPNG